MASTTAQLENKLAILQNTIAGTSNDLAQKLADQQNQNNDIGETLNGIASTVGTLQKLSQTDKELLQKYSKVYFLNENYIPLKLATIDPKYLYDENKTMQFHATALPYLTQMLDELQYDNLPTVVASAYRSFGTQGSLKSSYTVTYGSGANSFSADQGYSEHQLGTAIDFAAPKTGTLLDASFEKTGTFTWLINNAYKYGFILSYPKNNKYYQYEPWHWRFVGVQLATYLHNHKENFYDLDQRELDTYLVNIFDPIE